MKLFPERKFQRIFTFEEQARYLEHAGPTLRDFAVLMVEMGLRPQDLYDLEDWSTDLEARLLRLWPLSAAGTAPKQGKTSAARRAVPITDDMLPIIERRLELARRLGTRWLFPSPRNPQRHITQLGMSHRRALAAAGIRDRVRLYDLRHTGLTRLHEAGVSDLTLKALAGHEKLQTTSRYIRIGDQAKIDAVRKLERTSGRIGKRPGESAFPKSPEGSRRREYLDLEGHYRVCQR